MPSGTVSFTIDGVVEAPVSLNGSGQATLSTSALGVGDHNVIAIYNGDENFTAGSSGVLSGNPQVVHKAESTTGLTS